MAKPPNHPSSSRLGRKLDKERERDWKSFLHYLHNSWLFMLFMTADISVVVARSRGLVLRFATQTPHPERVVETGAGIFSPKLMAFCSSVWEGKCCCFFFTSRGPLLPIGGGCWWWWSEWFYFNLISIYCTFKKLFFTPGTLPPRFLSGEGGFSWTKPGGIIYRSAGEQGKCGPRLW